MENTITNLFIYNKIIEGENKILWSIKPHDGDMIDINGITDILPYSNTITSLTMEKNTDHLFDDAGEGKGILEYFPNLRIFYYDTHSILPDNLFEKLALLPYLMALFIFSTQKLSLGGIEFCENLQLVNLKAPAYENLDVLSCLNLYVLSVEDHLGNTLKNSGKLTQYR
jgi:hypothetical protein